MSSTILIVDDKKANIDLLSSILRQDFTLMAAINGESAIHLLERKKPDLVLLDVFMPGIDGFDIMRYMKSNAALANIPVIFVTGEHDDDVEEKGLSLGAMDYIKKPFNAAVVRYKVRNHISYKAYHDELELLVSDRTTQLTASREAIVMGMSLMSESHDPISSGHIERIKSYTRILTQQIAKEYPQLLSQELAGQIILYAPLHDMGKIEIPDHILSKQGMLTPDEFLIMKRHALVGGELLRKTEMFFYGGESNDSLRVAIEIAEGHHERYDGSGYPRGLKGEEIPLSARIVGLADVYDGLRSKRPYKKDYSHEETVNIILNGGDNIHPSHFDPTVLEVFGNIYPMFEGGLV